MRLTEDGLNKNQSNSLSLLSSLYKYLSFKRKLQIWINLLLALLNAAFEIFSIGIIFPLLNIVINPKEIETNKYLSTIYNFFNSYGENYFLYFIIISTLLIVSISLIVKLTNLRYTIKLAQNIGTDLCKSALNSYLNKSYVELKNTNSADMISGINKNIEGSIIALESFLQLVTSTVLAISIFIALLLISKNITLIAFSTILLVYYFLSIYSKNRLTKNSNKIVINEPFRQKYLQESLQGIRDVILSDLQDFFVFNFGKYDSYMRVFTASNGFIVNSARYIIEYIVLVLICLIIISFLLLDNVNINSFAILGTFAIGCQKLLPSLQTIFRMLSNLRGFKYQIIEAINILSTNKDNKQNIHRENIKFDKHISLNKISFKYPNTEKIILNDINFKLRKGECIGIKGTSGAGKSTFADIIMTLLTPNSGEYFVDNFNILEGNLKENIFKWRKSIAHVPQEIFIADTTIAENIAFGLSKGEIDYKKIISCCRQSKLLDFINSLPNQFETIVGENGSLLSGGQRQRIAIARALYKDAQILILDEATSSLDNETENSVIESIKNIKGKVTIIFITHRLSTLNICDRIIEFKNGKLLETLKN
ncbi:ABC transporter [Prochlorococcus marinus subsp. pastoris str. CCMP1986]|uniref:ABC transporter n=1 Tax=Prochlorococcus marinus subsp. pastoris (strain CCMP1986 / NIES-2087 / MED4) TaxID=59919 RepID=Q7V0L7_PROMP|nr:ATP-binding cassette domain-containing protein [Prochlorococcus marinus]KGF87198.1 Phospholipid-lipopolysaccharide ABC transporter [Prochlorococcus marinus str. EQPAC1]CAE19698.1 ABC transporter [Prochlorococcus marinus subsp. pastoris str. CCMP1986]